MRHCTASSLALNIYYLLTCYLHARCTAIAQHLCTATSSVSSTPYAHLFLTLLLFSTCTHAHFARSAIPSRASQSTHYFPPTWDIFHHSSFASHSCLPHHFHTTAPAPATLSTRLHSPCLHFFRHLAISFSATTFVQLAWPHCATSHMHA